VSPSTIIPPSTPPPPLHANVKRMGWVSALTDVSSEMLYAVTPIFVTEVLKAPVRALGWIEGLAEGTASILKGVSGWHSDRIRRRKRFILAGYSLSAISKPLIAVAGGWPLVLVARFLDRFGKGIRTAPRDALIADSTAPEIRGRAFGLHRAMDTGGALIGVAITLGLLYLLMSAQPPAQAYRSLYWIAFLPAAAGVLLIPYLREISPASPLPKAAPKPLNLQFGRRYYLTLSLFAVTSIGLSSDAFLLLRTREAGWSTPAMIGAYLCYNAAYALLSYPVGKRADRVRKESLLGLGMLVYSAVYLGFALLPSPWLVWPLFALYGLYAALTDGVSKALISNLVGREIRATALGFFHMVTGVAAVVASVLAGWLWEAVSVAAPFYLGSALALIGGLGFLLWRPVRDHMSG